MEKGSRLLPIVILLLAIFIGVGTRVLAKKLSAYPTGIDASIEVFHNTDPQKEYATLQLSGISSGTPRIASDFSLLQNGFLVKIGGSVKTFLIGEVTETRPIVLTESGTVVIHSGRSPVGVSFQENKCTGFLQEFQEFTPPLLKNCPRINDLIAKQGVDVTDECRSYFDTLPECISLPSSAPTQCKDVLIEFTPYNQCVEALKNDQDFTRNTWQVYLESPTSLWATTSPIQLLDHNKILSETKPPQPID